MEKLYKEEKGLGNKYRSEYLGGINAMLEAVVADARELRNKAVSPMAMAEDRESFRRRFCEMTGLSGYLASGREIPRVNTIKVGEDDISVISRFQIEMPYGVRFYAMLFVPKGKNGKLPLVISQHGGLGSPEICSYIDNDGNNYNDMTRRVLRRGYICFAPQLLLWNKEDGNESFDRQKTDRLLKQCGGSIAGLEISYIMRALDYLISLDFVDETRIGMLGLSYGGFYTLYTAASDTRIKSAYASCFPNDRMKHIGEDYAWKNAALSFLDGEIGGLCAPRSLYIEAADKDPLFAPDTATETAREIAEFYSAAKCPEKFRFKLFEGGHELDKADDGINFLLEGLK